MPIPFFSELWRWCSTGYKKVTIKLNNIYGFAEQALLIQSLLQIVNSCVVIKHQLSLAKVGDFSEKKGMSISPDPLRGGAYNLQSISDTPEEKGLEDETYDETMVNYQRHYNCLLGAVIVASAAGQ